MSGSALLFLKRGQGFKPYSRMKLQLWPTLYPLRVDPVRVEINLSCGMNLKISPIVGVHSGPSHGSDKKNIYYN